MSTAKTTAIPDSLNQRVAITTWPALLASETGEPVEAAQFADRSVQISGSFGGASVIVEGSNDGVSYFPLTDPQGNSLTFTASKLEAVTELTRWLRPRVSGGDGTTEIAFVLLAKW
ncbi:hypothetical protein [Dongia sp.]|uniref:hypothetical protein n=1 Tax=Dongia sp. TaxID=1977262 RepID=UPI0035AF7A6A